MSNWDGYQQEPYNGQDAVGTPYGEPVPYGEMPQMDVSAAVEQAKRAHARRKNSGFVKFLILLAIVTVGIVVFEKMVLRLETVYVIGNELKTPQQVVTASGLARGRNMLGIEEAEIAAAMARDHTLIFKGMQKEYPNTLYLYIEERKPAAVMQWLGLLYTLDGQGMVLTDKTDAASSAGMPLVTGLVANTVQVGQVLNLRTIGQMEAYCEIMNELQLQLYADQVAEINLADPESIYLVTVEGVTVRLGDASQMRAKIGAVNSTMAKLRQWGEIGGLLDVTTPITPKYRPED